MPSGTTSGKGVYLTVYPSSHPNMDTVFVALNVVNPELVSMKSNNKLVQNITTHNNQQQQLFNIYYYYFYFILYT